MSQGYRPKKGVRNPKPPKGGSATIPVSAKELRDKYGFPELSQSQRDANLQANLNSFMPIVTNINVTQELMDELLQDFADIAHDFGMFCSSVNNNEAEGDKLAEDYDIAYNKLRQAIVLLLGTK